MKTRYLVAFTGLVALAAASTGATGCSSSSSDDPPATTAAAWTKCQDSSQAFVRRAIFALIGRRPLGQGEVNAYQDLLDGALASGLDERAARTVVARAIMADPAFQTRWLDFTLDAMRVIRTNVERESVYDLRQAASCFSFDGTMDAQLATWVRDNPPSAKNPPVPKFNFGQLLSSAIALDDLSPAYRAYLFEMLSFAVPAPNVAADQQERARRQDFASTFQSVYLHRDLTCLQCHNSEFSVTGSPDPERNRTWATPGLFERALFGSSTADGDYLRYQSMLRHVDVADGGGDAPWGWNDVNCGTFKVPKVLDPLNVDTYFATIQSTAQTPQQGKLASAWQTELSLRRGVDTLGSQGLVLNGSGEADPDSAFAYLLAENLSERVWTEIIGTSLTIINYFPRTRDQREVLDRLTKTFISNHFSLKSLLIEIVTDPAFNLRSPSNWCDDTPYEIPRLFNPWSDVEVDAEMRGNSTGDIIHHLSSRPLRRSLNTAMLWPQAPEFPLTPEEESFQIAIGHYITNSEPGFRGLDFQGRLAWENAYGTCAPRSSRDFIVTLVEHAQQTPGATVEQAVVALKDRLLGETSLDPVERAPLAALMDTPLESTDLSRLDAQLRAACGAYVSSPQFLLGGTVPPDTRDIPALDLPADLYDQSCAQLRDRLAQTGAPVAVTCGGSSLAVARR